MRKRLWAAFWGFVLAVSLFAACDLPEKSVEVQRAEDSWGTFEVVLVRGCYYVAWRYGDGGAGLAHAGNCPNHRNADYVEPLAQTEKP